MRPEKLFQKVQNSPANIHFADICKLAEAFGFRLSGKRGSHRVYTRPRVREILNFQNVGGKAKPYHVRQFLAVIHRYELKLRGD